MRSRAKHKLESQFTTNSFQYFYISAKKRPINVDGTKDIAFICSSSGTTGISKRNYINEEKIIIFNKKEYPENMPIDFP